MLALSAEPRKYLVVLGSAILALIKYANSHKIQSKVELRDGFSLGNPIGVASG